MMFRGNWASLLLPWTEEGELDLALLEEEILILVDAQVDGIYSCGSAGEFHLINRQEFATVNALLSRLCRQHAVRFQIGASHQQPYESLELLKCALALEPDGVQLIAPDWWRASPEVTIEFLRRASQCAGDSVPLVLYNPPHAKNVYTPEELIAISGRVPMLKGVKVAGGDEAWYRAMSPLLERDDFSVFIPGHLLASGVKRGADGAYSNVCCINPYAAQRWWQMIDRGQWREALELEQRINEFMRSAVVPYIERGVPNYLMDRAMAVAGGWCRISERCKWPYRGLKIDEIEGIRQQGQRLIPEFFVS